MQVIEVTYKDGAFVPVQKLNIEKEGKKFKILIIERGTPETEQEEFFRFVDRFSFTLPEDYTFDRDEIYES